MTAMLNQLLGLILHASSIAVTDIRSVISHQQQIASSKITKGANYQLQV